LTRVKPLIVVAHARQLGANAIVGMRDDGSTLESGSSGGTEVLGYGVAVVVEPISAWPHS
jgi:uncharacterized protein YbjQ (UPF0145 family)